MVLSAGGSVNKRCRSFSFRSSSFLLQVDASIYGSLASNIHPSTILEFLPQCAYESTCRTRAGEHGSCAAHKSDHTPPFMTLKLINPVAT